VTGPSDNAAFFTGADSGFLSLLDDLLSSLGGKVPGDFYVLDFGLDEAEVLTIKHRHPWAKTVSLPYEEHPQILHSFMYKSMLPQFVGGYDVYAWVDADIWFQDPSALEDLITLAPETEINLIAEAHPAYGAFEPVSAWLRDTYGAMFLPELAAEMAQKIPLNAGLFAAKGNSSLWSRWQAILIELLKDRAPGAVSDQGVLNYLIYKEGLAAGVLPAINNWMAHLAPPKWDTDLETLCPPGDNDQPIRALHLTADAKDMAYPVMCDGQTVETGFRYTDVRRNLRKVS